MSKPDNRDVWLCFDMADSSEDGMAPDPKRVLDPNGNLIGSSVGTKGITRDDLIKAFHKPVLDMDFPCELKPSETPGHFHLYINKLLTWEQYERLLLVMMEIGLLEPGYVSASIDRGSTFVSPRPWKEKNV